MNHFKKAMDQFKLEADETLFKDLHFDSRLEEQVRERLKDGDDSKNLLVRPSLRRWKKWVLNTAVAAALLCITLPGAYYLQNSFQKGTTNNSNQVSMEKKSIPASFSYPIEIAAESYPVHPNQTLTIKPYEKIWTGKEVKIYYLPDTDSNEDELMYKKVLPQEAKFIGQVPIEQGKWSFQWSSPSQLKPGGYNSFLLAVQSDEGTLSAVRLMTLQYNSLEISPSAVKAGQKVELKGTGFPVGDIRVDLIKRESNGTTAFQINIGRLHSYNSSFNYTFEVVPNINGQQISPGTYQVLVVYDTPGTAGAAVSVNLEVE